MFIVWDSAGTQTSYVPGVIRKRQVEHIHPISPVHHRAKGDSFSIEQEPHSSTSHVAARAYQESNDIPSSRQPAILAKQIMTTPVFTLAAAAPLSEAWQAIQTNRFRHIPILSKAGTLIGILSDRDLLRATIQMASTTSRKIDSGAAAPVQKIMTTNILSATPDTEIRVIARVMFEERIGAMPLVNDQEKVVGILTRSDILRTVVNEAPFELWI